NPAVGNKAAEDSQSEIRDLLKGSDMVFITCGLGGGTGTGAAPVIANMAKEAGALTVAVVTKPFAFEGIQRRDVAERGFNSLRDKVDAIVTIPNDRLLQIIDKKTPLLEAFKICDEILKQGVQGIAQIITVPGLINVDFADVKTIMQETGSALMGIGQGSGENRAAQAAKSAISSPLLELSIDGAKGILFTIIGGSDLSMYEVNEAAKIITQSADPNAKIIFGAVIDESLKDEVKITVIATGFSGRESRSNANINVAESTLPKEPAYTPSEFIENKNRQAEEEISRVPKKIVKKIFAKEDVKTPEEEELEIPAFIRKKMK
ncbi:MAG: cell division protein FtsZ, partial [Candidatus Buchananbacteria bacterium]